MIKSSVRVTKTQFTGHLAADGRVIIKLHFFLANWADSQSRPSYKPSPDVAQVA